MSKKVTLNKQDFIKKFVSEFLILFPDLYDEKTLYTKLNQNISYIVQEENFEDNEELEKNPGVEQLGFYNSDNKTIHLLNKEFDSVAFHEMIHALNNEFIEAHFDSVVINEHGSLNVTLLGLNEAFTEYATKIYENSKIGQNDRYFHINNSIIYLYDIGTYIAEQLEIIYKMKTGRSMLETFLSGKDIRICIYELFKDEIFNSEIPYTQKEISELAATYMYYYANMLDCLVLEKDFSITKLLQKINKRFFYSQSEDLQFKNKKNFNLVLYHDKVNVDSLASTKLLNAIFGENYISSENNKINHTTSIEDVMSQYIEKIDNGRVK